MGGGGRRPGDRALRRFPRVGEFSKAPAGPAVIEVIVENVSFRIRIPGQSYTLVTASRHSENNCQQEDPEESERSKQVHSVSSLAMRMPCSENSVPGAILRTGLSS